MKQLYSFLILTLVSFNLYSQYRDGKTIQDISDRTFRYEARTGLFTNVNGKQSVRYAYDPQTNVMTELSTSVTSGPILIKPQKRISRALTMNWELIKNKTKSIFYGTTALLDFFRTNKGFKDGDVIYYDDERMYTYESRTGYFKKSTGKENERFLYDPYKGTMTTLPWEYTPPQKAKTFKNNKFDSRTFEANLYKNATEFVPIDESFRLKGKRILIIDDEATDLKKYSEIFNIDGAIIETASSWDDFVELFRKNKYDFIFADMHLGFSLLGFNGNDIARAIRLSDKKVPVIGISRAPDLSTSNMWNDGFTGYYELTVGANLQQQQKIFRSKCSIWSNAPNLFFESENKTANIEEIETFSLETKLRKYLTQKENTVAHRFDNLKINELIDKILSNVVGSNRQELDANDWFTLSTTELFSFIKKESATNIKRKYDLFLLSGMIMDQYIYSKERPEPIEYINPFLEKVIEAYKEENFSAIDLLAVKKHFNSLYGKNELVFDLISRGVMYEIPVSFASTGAPKNLDKWREKYLPAIEQAYERLGFYLAKAQNSKTEKQFYVDRCDILVKNMKRLIEILGNDETLQYASICDGWLTKVEEAERSLDKLSSKRKHIAKPTYQESDKEAAMSLDAAKVALKNPAPLEAKTGPATDSKYTDLYLKLNPDVEVIKGEYKSAGQIFDPSTETITVPETPYNSKVLYIIYEDNCGKEKVILSDEVPNLNVGLSDPDAEILATHRSMYNKILETEKNINGVIAAGDITSMPNKEVAVFSNRSNTFHGGIKNLTFALEFFKKNTALPLSSLTEIQDYGDGRPALDHATRLAVAKAIIKIANDPVEKEFYTSLVNIQKELTEISPSALYPGEFDFKNEELPEEVLSFMMMTQKYLGTAELPDLILNRPNYNSYKNSIRKEVISPMKSFFKDSKKDLLNFMLNRYSQYTDEELYTKLQEYMDYANDDKQGYLPGLAPGINVTDAKTLVSDPGGKMSPVWHNSAISLMYVNKNQKITIYESLVFTLTEIYKRKYPEIYKKDIVTFINRVLDQNRQTEAPKSTKAVKKGPMVFGLGLYSEYTDEELYNKLQEYMDLVNYRNGYLPGLWISENTTDAKTLASNPDAMFAVWGNILKPHSIIPLSEITVKDNLALVLTEIYKRKYPEIYKTRIEPYFEQLDLTGATEISSEKIKATFMAKNNIPSADEKTVNKNILKTVIEAKTLGQSEFDVLVKTDLIPFFVASYKKDGNSADALRLLVMEKKIIEFVGYSNSSLSSRATSAELNLRIDIKDFIPVKELRDAIKEIKVSELDCSTDEAKKLKEEYEADIDPKRVEIK